jgi:aldose 1-epimerase
LWLNIKINFLMFQITRSPFGAFTRVDVTNTANGSSFSIVPEMGATLIDLVFNGHSVMDGYKTPAELEEGKWAKSAFLFPFPNRLRDGRYTWNGHTYQFPINNATTDNAIHGFVRHKPFTLADTVIGKKEAFVVLDYEDDGSNEAYPFRFTISLMISLDLENRFEFDVSILNQNQFQIPFGMGWHPYFRLAPNADQHLLQTASMHQN